MRPIAALLPFLPILLAPAATHAQNVLTVGDASGTPGATVELTVSLESDVAFLGWSFGVCVDPGALAVSAAALPPTLTAMQPEMFAVDLPPEGARALVLLSLDPVETLAPQIDFPLLTLDATLLGTAGSASTVAICTGIGDPPVDVVLASASPPLEVVPTTVDGTVTVTALPTTPIFQRIDCNQDGGTNVADPIFLLAELFSGGPPSPCRDACDANDDGSVNVADAVTALASLFQGAPIIPPVTCGEDRTADALPCPSPICP